MQMQAVKSEQGHGIQFLLDELLALEAAGLVYHQSAMFVAGIVENGAAQT